MSIPVAAITPGELTTAEREHAIHLLEQSRDQVRQAVHGLSEGQLHFKPAPDSWSAIEIVEHLGIVQGFVKLRLDDLANGAAPDPAKNAHEVDALIEATVPDRTTKVKGPEAGKPTGRWGTETLDQYCGLCDHLIEVARSASGLRGHTSPHPILGALDGYQWLLAAACHNERHRRQMVEVISDPNFPQP